MRPKDVDDMYTHGTDLVDIMEALDEEAGPNTRWHADQHWPVSNDGIFYEEEPGVPACYEDGVTARPGYSTVPPDSRVIPLAKGWYDYDQAQERFAEICKKTGERPVGKPFSTEVFWCLRVTK